MGVLPSLSLLKHPPEPPLLVVLVTASPRRVQQSVMPAVRPACPLSSGQPLSTMSCGQQAEPRNQVSYPSSEEELSAAPHRSILLEGKLCLLLYYTKYLLSNLIPLTLAANKG